MTTPHTTQNGHNTTAFQDLEQVVDGVEALTYFKDICSVDFARYFIDQCDLATIDVLSMDSSEDETRPGRGPGQPDYVSSKKHMEMVAVMVRDKVAKLLPVNDKVAELILKMFGDRRLLVQVDQHVSHNNTKMSCDITCEMYFIRNDDGDTMQLHSEAPFCRAAGVFYVRPGADTSNQAVHEINMLISFMLENIPGYGKAMSDWTPRAIKKAIRQLATKALMDQMAQFPALYHMYAARHSPKTPPSLFPLADGAVHDRD